MNIVEVASTLDYTGQKRVSLMYNVDLDSLYIKENNFVIKILPNNLDEAYIKLQTDYDLLKIELEDIKNKINELKSTGYITGSYNNIRNVKLTNKEQQIGYYYYCMTNNFGQGEGKVFTGMLDIPFKRIEELWLKIVKKYNLDK